MTETDRFTVQLREALLEAVRVERARQEMKWGEQNHPNGTGSRDDKDIAEVAKAICDFRARKGDLTWKHILDEEVKEAFAEVDDDKLEAELIQVAAVAISWCEAIRRKPRTRGDATR